MPYISQKRREALDDLFGNPMSDEHVETSGELNYLFTKLSLEYVNWKKYVGDRDDYSYNDLNDVVGALEGAKAEFQRRIVTPYEDRKIHENGDVY